jgi:hypothetical protein
MTSVESGIPNPAVGPARLAVVLEGVSTKWQMNVLQVLATPVSVQVEVDGYGTVFPIAYSISAEQARMLALQISEALRRESCPPARTD